MKKSNWLNFLRIDFKNQEISTDKNLVTAHLDFHYFYFSHMPISWIICKYFSMKKKSRLLVTRKNTSSEEKGIIPNKSLLWFKKKKKSDEGICDF